MTATAYTAENLTKAARPVVITIGRAFARPGRCWAPFRALSAWYVRRFRTWEARPVSTVQMLALQAVAANPFLYLLELGRVLRAVFPRRWYQWLTGDPVRLILALFADRNTVDVGQAVIAALMTAPGVGRDESTAELTPWEQLRRDQRRIVRGDAAGHGKGLSLAVASLVVRHACGDGWYFNRARWATADGYAPFALVLLEYIGLQTIEARARLVVADGFAMTQAKDVRAARRPFEQLAYPTER